MCAVLIEQLHCWEISILEASSDKQQKRHWFGEHTTACAGHPQGCFYKSGFNFKRVQHQ